MCHAGEGKESGVFIAKNGGIASPTDLIIGNPLGARQKQALVAKLGNTDSSCPRYN